MKITIELEIQPDEVALATELISTLRSLTDHVKVEAPGGGGLTPHAAPAVPPPSGLPVAPSPSGVPRSVPHVPNGGAAYPSATHGAPPHVAQMQQPASAAQPVQQPALPNMPPAAAVVPPSAPPPQPSQIRVFMSIVPRLGNPVSQDQAISDIITVLRSVEETRVDKACEELVAVYEQCVFDNPEVIGTSSGVMPYILLYKRLPDDLRTKLREKLVSKVVTTLTKKRPINADRSSFFAYADAFACLVKFEAVPLEGAIQTLSRLLQKVDSRCAAVTMLGKTVEYCGEQLLRVPESVLSSLWRALETVKEEVFQYDMHYILNTLQGSMASQAAQTVANLPAVTAPAVLAGPAALGPNAQASPAGSGGAAASAAAAGGAAMPSTPGGNTVVPAPPATVGAGGTAPAGGAAGPPAQTTPTSVTQIGTYNAHTGTVFSLYYDSLHGQLFSAGQDGQLLAWGPDGTPVARMDISSHYICSLNMLPRSGTIVAAAVPIPEYKTGEPSCVLSFAPPPGVPRVGSWTPRGRLNGPSRGILSFATPLGGDGDVFVIGESNSDKEPGMSRDIVYLYDPARGGPFEKLTPVRQYTEHTDMVTCAVSWNSNPNVFVTSGRDHNILVWDRRVDGNVGIFGQLNPTNGRTEAHMDMVTGLDTTDNLLLSTSVDACMCIWDFRQLSMNHGSVTSAIVRMQVDQTPMLKLAMTGAPHSRLAAISTYTGVHVVDFTNMTAPLTVGLTPPPDYVARNYHDIRWAGGQPIIFAASEDSKINVFGVNF